VAFNVIKTIGRYEIYDELGRGAMAIVYRAFDPKIKRMLAIKVLRPEFAENPAYRERFLSEARAAGTLTHPGIVTVFDVGEVDEQPFMAMELLEGATLEQFVRTKRHIPGRMILKIAIQLVDALDYAHRNGVVHRDIKPENIVCISDVGQVKIMDFGIAQIKSGSTWSAPDNTVVAGTPRYMSPEQVTGKLVDGRSDLYSLGVILFWLLSGTPPYSATTMAELFKKVVHVNPARLRPVINDVPEALVDVVHSLLKKLPEERYQSGAELLEDLRHIELDMAEHERSWGHRRIIPIRLRWSAFMGVIVAVTVLIGLSAVYQRQRDVVTGLAYDYGATLGRIVAAETAEDLLLEDQAALRTLVKDMQRNHEMLFLSIRDYNGKLLVSTLPPEAVNAAPAVPVAARGEQKIYRQKNRDGEETLRFESPVFYQQRRIGQVDLGVSGETVNSASRTTMTAMLALLVVITSMVSLAAYLMSRRLSAPIEVLRRGMGKIAQGRFDTRIRMRRRDEFERVFAAYNVMAESLEARPHADHGEAPAQPDEEVDAQAEEADAAPPVAHSSRTQPTIEIADSLDIDKSPGRSAGKDSAIAASSSLERDVG